MELRTEQKLPIILFIVFLILTMFGILFYQSTTSLQQAILIERQTNDFLSISDDLMTSCLDTETAVRGFMFTGSDTYLDPYFRSKAKVPEALAKLRAGSSDDVTTLEEIDRLAAALTEFQRNMDQKVELRKSEGYAGSLSQIVAPGDKGRLDDLRASVNRLKQIRSNQQQVRDFTLDKGLTRTVWILIISSVAGIIALGLANFVVFTEIKKRSLAETALIDANKGLEEKIESRTAELKVMNERLLDIGSERELLLIKEKRSRQEAEIANRLRDEFMATVSHELRTPLNSILGWARLMREGGLNESQAERAITTIIKNSETQNRLIEDLMDVARLISGKLELDQVNLELSEVVAESIESAKPAADARGLTIRFEGTPDHVNLIVNGDRNRLRQVFSNLLTNAIKFSHEGGEIIVTVSENNGMGIVRVRDEGTGISKEFLPLVFERFRQDTSASSRNGGLGLGLAIVRNLVEMHGGTVSVESDGENKGAEFTVRLPLVQD